MPIVWRSCIDNTVGISPSGELTHFCIFSEISIIEGSSHPSESLSWRRKRTHRAVICIPNISDIVGGLEVISECILSKTYTHHEAWIYFCCKRYIYPELPILKIRSSIMWEEILLSFGFIVSKKIEFTWSKFFLCWTGSILDIFLLVRLDSKSPSSKCIFFYWVALVWSSGALDSVVIQSPYLLQIQLWLIE